VQGYQSKIIQIKDQKYEQVVDDVRKKWTNLIIRKCSFKIERIFFSEKNNFVIKDDFGLSKIN